MRKHKKLFALAIYLLISVSFMKLNLKAQPEVTFLRFNPDIPRVEDAFDRNDANIVYWPFNIINFGLQIIDFDIWSVPYELNSSQDAVASQASACVAQWDNSGCLELDYGQSTGCVLAFSSDPNIFTSTAQHGATLFAVVESFDGYEFDIYPSESLLYQRTTIYLNGTDGYLYEWTIAESNIGVNYTPFKAILLHELGHLVGLGHIYAADGVVMDDNATHNEYLFNLTSTDRNALAELCAFNDTPVGVNDYLNINELTATETIFEDGNYFYEAVFVDADNDGTTFNDYNWELKLFHSNGEYIYSSSNSGILTGNYDCLPAGYNWTLVNGKIQGEVICYGNDSDGIYQEDTFPIEAEVANDCLIAPVISHFTQTPTPICQGSFGYVYVHLEQGSGTLNYSWQKENLPAGAYITPLGSKCRITYPSSSSLASKQQDGIMLPTNAVKCTVSNSAGSDSRSTNVSMSSLCDPSGCPTLAFNNGSEKVDENTLLISSFSNPGEDVTDYYLINTNDKILNGNIDFYIHEPEEEHTWFDEIELWELKANHGEFIAVTDEGEFINFKEKQKPFKYILNEKIDVTAELESNDGKTFSFMPGDLLRIENANGKELSTIQTTTTTYATLIAVKPPHSDKIIAGDIYIAKEKGKNPQISSETFGIGGFYLRDNMSTVSKKIGKLDENDAVEIIFNNETEIDYFVLTDNLKTVKAEKLELISSEKGSEDLGSRINQTDETYAELLPGEEIHFKYKTKQNVDKKKKIKHVLKVVGRYEKLEIEGLSIGKEKGDGITSVEEELPKENRLFDNYPNPFNPTTTIKYELKEAVNLTLKVYDSLGRIVKTIEEGIKPAGRYEVSFDGSELSSGMYFYRLQSDKFNFTKKMLMIK